MKRPKVPQLNLSGIRCRSTSKMTAQSYSQGTNHHNESEFFDIRIGSLDISIKVGVAKKYARRVA